MNDAITTLRAMYRNVRAHARGEIHGHSPLDVQAYILALLAVAADGGDVWRLTQAFEAFGYWTRLSALGMSEGAADLVRKAKAERGWRGAMHVASTIGLTDVWAIAHTAHFGPAGIHESRLGADGVPTLETMAECPRVAECMEAAARQFDITLGWYDRVLAGKSYASQVVEYRKPAQAA